MSSHPPTSPQTICEDILRAGKRYNIEHSILPSENIVIDRLLARSSELKDAYEELYRKLHWHPPALQVFLQLILSTTAFWNPNRISEARAARDKLERINQEIARKAAELTSLLEQRSDLHDTSGFAGNTHYHVCEVLETAAENNHRFELYVRKPLRDLRFQFDLKLAVSERLHAGLGYGC